MLFKRCLSDQALADFEFIGKVFTCFIGIAGHKLKCAFTFINIECPDLDIEIIRDKGHDICA